MCFGGKPPKAPAPPAAIQQEEQVDAAVQASRENERRRQRATAGYQSTLLTGGQGVLAPANVGKTLLG